MKKRLLHIAFAILCAAFHTSAAFTQSTSVFTTGLQGPTKIITAGQNHFLVTETGTAMPSTSRISLVDRATGARRTLIDGLPSAFNTVENAPSGASGLKLSGLKLYLTTGQGDSVVPAIPACMGCIVANPKPITPLNNSILELTLPADYEAMASGFTLYRRAQYILADGEEVTLTSFEGRTMNIRMVANLPDHRPETRPGLPPNNVRPANLFGVEIVGTSLYVVDASFNQVYKVNPLTGTHATLAVFPPRPNPLPFGPPVFEAVPDSVRLFKNQLLVTFLTGFPFPQNLAEARLVNPETGVHQAFIGGLSAAIDILPVPLAGNNDSFYVLEYSSNFLGQPQAPGRLKLFIPAADGVSLTSTTILSNLVSPTSMARDAETGDVFITEIFPGRITRLNVGQQL